MKNQMWGRFCWICVVGVGHGRISEIGNFYFASLCDWESVTVHLSFVHMVLQAFSKSIVVIFVFFRVWLFIVILANLQVNVFLFGEAKLFIFYSVLFFHRFVNSPWDYFVKNIAEDAEKGAFKFCRTFVSFLLFIVFIQVVC